MLFEILSSSFQDLLEQDESSTFSVPDTTKEDVPLRPTKKAKTVTFDETCNVAYRNTIISEEDLKYLWYRDVEFRLISEATMRRGRRLAHEGIPRPDTIPYQDLMKRVYTRCLLTVPGESEAIYNPLSEEERMYFKRWFDLQPELIGLEFLTVQCLKAERRPRYRELLALVKELGMGEHQDDTADQQIRNRCESINQPGCIFAHCSAVALAESVKQDAKPEIPKKCINTSSAGLRMGVAPPAQRSPRFQPRRQLISRIRMDPSKLGGRR